MEPFSFQQIKKAAKELSERYRKKERPYLRSPEDRHAYLLTRLPATQAALGRVLRELSGTQVSFCLDIGAGPGASWEPLSERWPSLEQATFVELDAEFVKLGKERLQGKPVSWRREPAEKLDGIAPQDLVLFSYSWGEIGSLDVLEKAWNLCRQFLVIVEPGTPRGYEDVLKARDLLIQKGGNVIAPCPHHRVCPWQGSAEWCHFGVRLERSQGHRWAKEGSLGYEDEKFSYIIMAKEKHSPIFARMVRDSLKRKGHTLLTLCTNQGIEIKTVSKKEKELFKKVNKLKWGDKIIESI